MMDLEELTALMEKANDKALRQEIMKFCFTFGQMMLFLERADIKRYMISSGMSETEYTELIHKLNEATRIFCK